jgi:hypothetical protein
MATDIPQTGILRGITLLPMNSEQDPADQRGGKIVAAGYSYPLKFDVTTDSGWLYPEGVKD